MILVHDNGNVRIRFYCGFDQVTQKRFARVFARPRRTLHDHGAVGFVSRFHDRLDLLQVVDVERGQAVAVFSRMIE